MLTVSEGSWALVTGASSGIGEAFARKLAERKIPVLLVARTATALEGLADELGERHAVPVESIPLDLSRPESPAELFAATEGSGRPVDLLVNNAGFGLNGAFADFPPERTLDLLRLNVLATTELTQRYLVAMRARRRGRIVNVASTAAFVPGPFFAAYSASKAYVLSFTEAIHREAAPDGVTVTCVCPGYTRTNFHTVAGMDIAKRSLFPMMRPDDVAEVGLQALEKGKPSIVTHPVDRLWIASLRLVPRALPIFFSKKLFERSRAASS